MTNLDTILKKIEQATNDSTARAFGQCFRFNHSQMTKSQGEQDDFGRAYDKGYLDCLLQVAVASGWINRAEVKALYELARTAN